MPGSEAGHLHTVLLAFPPAGSATSIPATVGTSTSWSLATSGTGTSGGPSSHRCRPCAACVTGSGIAKAASPSWPPSRPSESTHRSCSLPCCRLIIPTFPMQITIPEAKLSAGSMNRCRPQCWHATSSILISTVIIKTASTGLPWWASG